MKCEYCGTENLSEGDCPKCGSQIKKPDFEKSEPFFYNGYICYTLKDLMTDTLEVQFWLGRELIERISFSRQFLEEFIPSHYEAMPFVWELFLLAKGEQEVVTYQEQNSKYPATFEIRRIENSKKEEIRQLRYRMLDKETLDTATREGFVKVE